MNINGCFLLHNDHIMTMESKTRITETIIHRKCACFLGSNVIYTVSIGKWHQLFYLMLSDLGVYQRVGIEWIALL